MVQVRPSLLPFAKYQLVLICLAIVLGPSVHAQSATLILNIRDPRGLPVDGTIVTLMASVGSYNQTLSTSNAASVTFEGLSQGEYDAEARCAGYQTATEHISVTAAGSSMQLYIYLLPESDQKSQGPTRQGLVASPKLQAEIDKGVEALRKRQFEVARTHFAKALSMAPGNPDLSYLMGTAELGLNHADIARQLFEHALAIDATHEQSLLALGELQLHAGEIPAAIVTLEKAFVKNGAGWRTHLLLAAAYAKAGRLPDAETHAQRAAELAREKGAGARLLLGEIQQAEGKIPEAQATLKELAEKFPGDPSAVEATKRIASLSTPRSPRVVVSSEPAELADLPVPSVPRAELLPANERPWAPPDIDSREYPLAENASCNAEDILPRAQHRLKSQLQNFEKFTATEHIDHQEIDRLGRLGPVKSQDFSYIVFVNRFGSDSFFLHEDRYSTAKEPSFPTFLATTGLNNLGVLILQPATREYFVYQCEGVAGIRGKAAWQIRFQEKKNSKQGVRNWRRDGKLYQIPIKGRIWLSSTSFDVLRIETDLVEPVETLGLTRDHLLVDYGPVNFPASKTTLWLPWSAEMYMELRGHRYHHKHYLTDYMLFEVDTNHKIGKPKNPPPPTTQATPAGDPNSLQK